MIVWGLTRDFECSGMGIMHQESEAVDRHVLQTVVVAAD